MYNPLDLLYVAEYLEAHDAWQLRYLETFCAAVEVIGKDNL